MHTTPALLLRRYPFTETSLIAVWFTQDFGKIRTTAKGARRPSSPFAGKMDLFYHCEVAFSVNKRESDLHSLREISLISSFPGIRQSWLKTSTAAYFSELIDQSSETFHPIPEIFDLLQRAFDFLHRSIPYPRAILFFEKELCRIHGLLPPNTSSHPSPHSLLHLSPSLFKSRQSLLQKLASETDSQPQPHRNSVRD